MRKILGSLIAIAALVSAGALATGAYFSTTASLGPVTLATGTPSLAVSFYTGPVVPGAIPPGWTNTYCVDMYNSGPYDLNVSKTVTASGSAGLWDAITLKLMPGTDCTGPWSVTDQGTLHAFNGYNAPLGFIASGTHRYVIETLAFPDTGDQNALVGQTINFTEVFTGQTP